MWVGGWVGVCVLGQCMITNAFDLVKILKREPQTSPATPASSDRGIKSITRPEWRQESLYQDLSLPQRFSSELLSLWEHYKHFQTEKGLWGAAKANVTAVFLINLVSSFFMLLKTQPPLCASFITHCLSLKFSVTQPSRSARWTVKLTFIDFFLTEIAQPQQLSLILACCYITHRINLK